MNAALQATMIPLVSVITTATPSRLGSPGSWVPLPLNCMAIPPVPLSERRLGLSWSRSNEPDFASYRLYRSYTPGVGSSTARELIADVTSQGNTEFTDTGLDPDSTYYYAVYVIDEIGLEAMSNEVAGTTLANEPPDPVELYTPWAPDTTSLEISWSESDASDFKQYELIGWEQDPPDPPNSADKRLLARFTAPDETFYTHESLIDTFTYWYQVIQIAAISAMRYGVTHSFLPMVLP